MHSASTCYEWIIRQRREKFDKQMDLLDRACLSGIEGVRARAELDETGDYYAAAAMAGRYDRVFLIGLHMAQKARAEQAERERDEARAEAARLREICKGSIDYVEDRAVGFMGQVLRGRKLLPNEEKEFVECQRILDLWKALAA